MKTLIYNNIRRSETDQAVIANLLRKGWIDATPPEKPEYDSSIEYLQYSGETNSWTIIQLSDEEKAQIQQNKADMEAATADAAARQQILDTIAAGYAVDPEGFVLGLTDSDRNAFTQMLALVKEALDLNLINNDTIQTIADINGVKHSVTTLRFRQIMVEYGFYYKNLWDQL